MNNPGKNRVWPRMIAAATLLVALIIWVGPSSLRETISEFHGKYYAIALGLLFLHFFVQSLSLRGLLGGQGMHVSTFHVFRLTIISNFFGVFLPGSIGPDLILCYNMARSTERKEMALSAIIFIRITVLLIMAVLAFAGSFHPLVARLDIQLLTGGALVAFAAYFFLMSNRHMLHLAEKALGSLNRHRLTALLYKTYFALSQIGRNRRSLLKIAPLLATSAVIKIIADYFIALALGIEIPLLYFFVFIPIITIVSAIPLTFAGLGVREGSYAGLFALAGIPAAQSITVSLTSFSLVIAIAVMGGVFYIIWGSKMTSLDGIKNEAGQPTI
jgi:uncharacterized protein (TIRG00374 family)